MLKFIYKYWWWITVGVFGIFYTVDWLYNLFFSTASQYANTTYVLYILVLMMSIIATANIKHGRAILWLIFLTIFMSSFDFPEFLEISKIEQYWD